MTPTDPQVQDELLAMVSELAEDWEYDGELTPDTRFLADMGLESLDIVVIGTMIQHRYGRLPFTELLAEIGERPARGARRHRRRAGGIRLPAPRARRRGGP